MNIYKDSTRIIKLFNLTLNLAGPQMFPIFFPLEFCLSQVITVLTFVIIISLLCFMVLPSVCIFLYTALPVFVKSYFLHSLCETVPREGGCSLFSQLSNIHGLNQPQHNYSI